MAFPYILGLSGYTPVFPTSVMTPDEAINENANGIAVSGEAFTVPAAADVEGRRRLNLNLVPFEQAGVAIVVNGDERILVDYGDAPAAGQVALSMETGVIEFHSSDAGLAGTASYTGRGTPWMAYQAVKLGKELAAAQTALRIGTSRQIGTTQVGKSLLSAGSTTLYTSPAGQEWTLDEVLIVGRTITGATVHPVVEITIGGLTAFEGVELTGLAASQVYPFSGPGMRHLSNAGAAVALKVITPAAASAYLVDVMCKGTRWS